MVPMKQGCRTQSLTGNETEFLLFISDSHSQAWTKHSKIKSISSWGMDTKYFCAGDLVKCSLYKYHDSFHSLTALNNGCSLTKDVLICTILCILQATFTLDSYRSNYKQAKESYVSVEGTLSPLLSSCERGGQDPADFAPQLQGARLHYTAGSTQHPQGGSPGWNPNAATTRGCAVCSAAGGSSCCNSWLGRWPEEVLAKAAGASPLPATIAAPAGCSGVGATTSAPGSLQGPSHVGSLSLWLHHWSSEGPLSGVKLHLSAFCFVPPCLKASGLM